MANKTNVLIAVLIAAVVILGGVVVYAFFVKPSINGYTVNAQNQGVQAAVTAILTQIQQNGYVQIPVGNQTLILVPYNPQTQTQTAPTNTGTNTQPQNSSQ